MVSETAADWSSDMTTSNPLDLFANSTTAAVNKDAMTHHTRANTILAADTMKIIYVLIGQFH